MSSFKKAANGFLEVCGDQVYYLDEVKGGLASVKLLGRYFRRIPLEVSFGLDQILSTSLLKTTSYKDLEVIRKKMGI